MEIPTKNHARRYTVEEWEQMKPKIRDLISNERQKLKDVIRIIEADLGYVVSEKQVKSRITKWGFDTKNVKGDAMLFMARMQAKRKRFQNKQSAFRIGKQPVNSEKISRYLKRKEISESSILDIASPVDAPSPPISVFTPQPDSPPPEVLYSPPVQSRQKLVLPSPLPSSSGAQTVNTVDLNDFTPQYSPLPTWLSQISSISKRSLHDALLSEASIRDTDVRGDDNCASKFDSRLMHGKYLHRPISNINQVANVSELAKFYSSHAISMTLPAWSHVSKTFSLCFEFPIKSTAQREAQDLVDILMAAEMPDTQSHSLLMLRNAEQTHPVRTIFATETHRVACLRILHEKFPGILTRRSSGSPPVAGLFDNVDDKKSDKPYFGRAHLLFDLLSLSLLSETQSDIASARVRWGQLSMFHMWDLSWLENYAGLCWAASEEFWRLGRSTSASESIHVSPGVYDTSRPVGVREAERLSNRESLSCRLQKWINIFVQINVRGGIGEIEYHVIDGKWELGIFLANFGMRFAPNYR